MVLRLFNLLQGSDYSPVVVSSIKSLLTLPQISFVFGTGQQELLHHIRFSIDYLRRSGLLDAQGNPINLFGLAAHLYYTEPSNFALITLMRRGIIHDICNQHSTEQAKREFLTLICHLFGRRLLPPVYTSDSYARNSHRKSASKVVLPAMPAVAKDVLLTHDDEILHIFTGYAVAFATARTENLEPECHLPLSKRRFGSGEPYSLFHVHLKQTNLSVVARSPFVANSGHDDHFGTVSELAHTCRSGLHLNEHSVPSMRQFTLTPGEDGGALPLNAYLLDFWIHGQPAALVTANGIRQGELWYLLEDFTLSLKTIRSTIEHLLLKSAESSESPKPSIDELDVVGLNLAEVDADEEYADGAAIKRPLGVSDRDWRVFEVVNQVTLEFDEKFKAMWA